LSPCPFFVRSLREALGESLLFNRIGYYWDRTGLKEIDIVAVNDNRKYIALGECMLNKDKASINQLLAKSVELVKEFDSYQKIYKV
jgi:hypothetical protein